MARDSWRGLATRSEAQFVGSARLQETTQLGPVSGLSDLVEYSGLVSICTSKRAQRLWLPESRRVCHWQGTAERFEGEE
jgi:hypothetical protein